MVSGIIASTAGLELLKGETKRLAPVEGTFGPFVITGNSCPVFTYVTFDEDLMEFINVQVSLNLPDRILFESRIQDQKNVIHTEQVVTKNFYKHPFYFLAQNIYNYFPLIPDETRNLVQINQGS